MSKKGPAAGRIVESVGEARETGVFASAASFTFARSVGKKLNGQLILLNIVNLIKTLFFIFYFVFLFFTSLTSLLIVLLIFFFSKSPAIIKNGTGVKNKSK